MKAYIDIENFKTQEVITICAKVKKYNCYKDALFDISMLNNEEKKLLIDAIDNKLTYIDIEMFFIDEDNTPNFGSDYKYEIKDNDLILTYKNK